MCRKTYFEHVVCLRDCLRWIGANECHFRGTAFQALQTARNCTRLTGANGYRDISARIAIAELFRSSAIGQGEANP